MTKILYSPGWGAGWSTWMDAPKEFTSRYQPIIDALEKGDTLTKDHPAVKQFVAEYKNKFPSDSPCLLGLDTLKITEVCDGERYRITDYDGFESVDICDAFDWETG